MHLGVIGLQSLYDRTEIYFASGHFVFIRQNSHLPALSAYHIDLCHIGNLLDFIRYHFGDLTNPVISHFIAPKRKRQSRHVIDRSCLYQRHCGALRHAVHILHQLIVQLHQRALHILSDIELHGNHSHTVHRSGIYVFHPFDIRNNFFNRLHHSAFHLLRGSSGITDHDVRHGNLYLRLFLARNKIYTERPQHQESNHQQNAQL